MTLKILHWTGIIACILLIVSCFLPWAYYPVINETFTGFNARVFPNGTYYGRPGHMIVVMTVMIVALMLTPRIWAKRVNLFLAGFLLAYALSKCYTFTHSLFDGEVVSKGGVFLAAISASLIMLSSLFPDVKLKQNIKS